MYLECQLVFKSYKPLALEKGMLFLTQMNGTPFVREITEVPKNVDEFISINGYPVEPYVMDIGNVNLKEEQIVATPEQIGWFDEGEHSDELSDISIKNMNDILEKFDGWIDVEMEETEDGDYVPLLYNNKITIRLPEDYDDDLWDEDIDDEPEEDDDYNNIY